MFIHRNTSHRSHPHAGNPTTRITHFFRGVSFMRSAFSCFSFSLTCFSAKPTALSNLSRTSSMASSSSRKSFVWMHPAAIFASIAWYQATVHAVLAMRCIQACMDAFGKHLGMQSGMHSGMHSGMRLGMQSGMSSEMHSSRMPGDAFSIQSSAFRIRVYITCTVAWVRLIENFSALLQSVHTS
jgi:hypothetical protein